MKRKIQKLTAFLFLFVVLAFANTQGPIGGTGSGAGWTGPTNIAVTDAVYATQSVLSLNISTALSTSTLGFSIPAGSTINGIQVDIVRHASSGSSMDFGTTQGATGVSLSKVAGTRVGTAKNDTTLWGTTDATTTFGSAADLWGTTWTAAEVNATGFGVVMDCENNNATLARTASIDSILVTVTFTPPPSQSQMLKVF